ncbi:MAG: FAD-dependent monooxygenase [Pseudomonadota bacterium]
MRSLSEEHVAVIGGGLGGLCDALCMSARGARVTVYEAAEAFTEVGAGIQVSSNGLKVLRALGLDPSGGVASRGLTLNDNRGRRVAILPNDARREVRLFHRADLLALLAKGCRERGVEIRFGARVGPEAAPEANLIIAADGVKSAFRAAVDPDLAAPKFTGQIAWRALVKVPTPVGEAGVNLYMGAGQHVVVYPLRGGKFINVVAAEDTDERAAEGWQVAASRADLQARFAQFGGPVPALLAAAEHVHHWGLFAHRLPTRWSEGRVVLLGDAAHAMLPYLAQGACAAFEDAYILAREWAGSDDPDEALGRYESLRAPRVARVTAEAQANARRFHHANPVARFIGYTGMRAASAFAPGLLARRFDWLYQYDATA